MISADTLSAYVAGDVPGCPDPLIKWGIRMAAQDFFRDTELWRIECDPVDTVGAAEVELDLPAGVVVNAIYHVYANGRLLVAGRPDTAASASEVWMTKTAANIEQFWLSPPTSLRLFPINTATASLRVYCSVVPGFSVSSFPEVVGDFAQTVAAGTLWKLQSMPGKSWSNDLAAQTNGALFNAGLVRARIRSNRAGNSAMRVTMRNT